MGVAGCPFSQKYFSGLKQEITSFTSKKDVLDLDLAFKRPVLDVKYR